LRDCKTAILGTATVGSAYVKVQNVITGNVITCAINCSYRTAATLYTAQTEFVLGIPLYTSCIKWNNNNNNNNNKTYSMEQFTS
jgi:hypothetical protein